jgi:hypothetical protein
MIITMPDFIAIIQITGMTSRYASVVVAVNSFGPSPISGPRMVG